MKRLLLMLCCSVLPGLAAGAEVRLCYNYGCASELLLPVGDAELGTLRALLPADAGALEERARLAQVVGTFYRWAGERSPISVDRPGDLLDPDEDGRMDCIDHATTTTSVLELLQAEGLLRHHRVLAPVVRYSALIFEHHSAAIAELAPGESADSAPETPAVLLSCDDCSVLPSGSDAARRALAGQYVVDSWFVEPGEPAVVLPMAAWLDGEGPNVQ